jgi:urocanate hydratase
MRSMKEDDTNALVQRVADEIKPHYLAHLKNAQKTEPDAYALAYGRAVTQVAKAHGTTEAKTRFLFRDVLQAIMNRATA